MRILFVCLGNICRSPAAEGVLRAMAQQRGKAGALEIDSAGTYGGHAGELPDPRMRAAAARRGYALTHRARRVELADFERFDRVVAMDDANDRTLTEMARRCSAQDKVVRMADFFRHYSGVGSVPDPYYGGAEGFDRVLDLLEDACGTLLDSLPE